MSEDEKIKVVIEKYSNLFKNYSADVGQTATGVWFFFEYDKEHDEYYSFIRFKTAEELERLIIGLLADDINCMIETTAENIFHNLKVTNIQDLPASNYENCTVELLRNLEILNQEYKQSSEKINEIFIALSDMISSQKY